MWERSDEIKMEWNNAIFVSTRRGRWREGSLSSFLLERETFREKIKKKKKSIIRPVVLFTCVAS